MQFTQPLKAQLDTSTNPPPPPTHTHTHTHSHTHTHTPKTRTRYERLYGDMIDEEKGLIPMKEEHETI